MIELSDVPMDVGIHEPLFRHARQSGGLAATWHFCESAYLITDGTWADHEKRVAKSVRKRLRNQRNRLCRMGEVRLEVLTSPNDVAEALAEGFEIERRSWKGELGTAIACKPSGLRFLTEMAGIAAELGWMRLAFLCVGETRVAFEYALQYNRRVYSLKIGYDEQHFSKFSVGRLLVRDSLVRCFDEELAEYDFLGPLTPAHGEWKPRTREIAWIHVYKKSFLSRLHYLTKFGLKPRLKRVLNRLRPPSKANFG